MIKLSVVIITFNEEKNLERCLKSVVDVADDIVVVDSFSKDKTKEIALSYGARFIEHAFEGHIEQKNWAITQAQNPYVLSLDADEALSEELKTSILKVKASWEHDGYEMNRLTNYCGKWIRHGGWYPDVKLRLWDSRKGSWGGVNPHDRYEMDRDAKIAHIHGDLLHYSYYTFEDHIKQVNKFTDIAANMLMKAGKSPSHFKIFFGPKFKFFRDYILKLGFLDGYYGYTIAKISAHANFLKYAKHKQMYLAKRDSDAKG